MRLVNITNSQPDLVREQLAHTDAFLVELYSLGNSTILYTDAKTHADIIIQNKVRKVSDSEVDYALKKLLKTNRQDSRIEIIVCDYFTEVTLTK